MALVLPLKGTETSLRRHFVWRATLDNLQFAPSIVTHNRECLFLALSVHRLGRPLSIGFRVPPEGCACKGGPKWVTN